MALTKEDLDGYEPPTYETEAEAREKLDAFVNDLVESAQRNGIGSIWMMAAAVVASGAEAETHMACRQTALGDPLLLKATSQMMMQLIVQQQASLDKALVEKMGHPTCPDCGLPHPPTERTERVSNRFKSRPMRPQRRPGGDWSAG